MHVQYGFNNMLSISIEYVRYINYIELVTNYYSYYNIETFNGNS